jgi:hypothetical protein
VAIESALVVYVACPPLTVPVPSVVVPSLNVIVPLGLSPVTVAVNVTTCAKPAGLGLATIVVVVVALLTTRLTVDDVLTPLFVSPP